MISLKPRPGDVLLRQDAARRGRREDVRLDAEDLPVIDDPDRNPRMCLQERVDGGRIPVADDHDARPPFR
jgi:hypothetical protein